jgi:hypothetical protein
VQTLTLSYTFFESTNPEGAKDLKRLHEPKDGEGPSAADIDSDAGRS